MSEVWTTAALKDYIDALLDSIQAQMDRRIEAEIRAQTAADSALGARLESMNEFRLQLTVERSTYVIRGEFEREIGLHTERLHKLESRQEAIDAGRGFLRLEWVIIASIFPVVLGIATLLHALGVI